MNDKHKEKRLGGKNRFIHLGLPRFLARRWESARSSRRACAPLGQYRRAQRGEEDIGHAIPIVLVLEHRQGLLRLLPQRAGEGWDAPGAAGARAVRG